MKRKPGLSKSKITLFEQCPKRLWLSVHRPELAQETSGTRAAFADGHRVGDVACSLHPDGVMIGAEQGLGKALDDTAALLRDGWNKPIFEATFAHDGVLVRADLMLPMANGWHVAEVKNTTGLKGYHLGDIATQIWVMRGAGVPITAASVRHLDRNFTLTQDGDYQGLFADTYVDAHVEPIVATRAGVVANARTVLEGDEPFREIGDHCTSPFTCSFQAYCGRNLAPPPEWPVMLLPGATGKKTARGLLGQGLGDLLHAPAGAMPTPMLARVHEATVSGTPWRDRDAILADTAGWAFPRIFLDFETIQFPIPRWIGTRPFDQVPFQFSAHIDDGAGTLTHTEFLSVDGTDPRRSCAEALASLPDTGAVITWNASFERTCIMGLAIQFPDLALALVSLANRLVDLMVVARHHYYHRDMRGSWSIKQVLPTLAPIGYEGLTDVKSGTDAQAGYIEAIDPATSPERAAALREALLAYCQRDTEAMVIILDALTR